MQQLQRSELIDAIVSNSNRLQCVILNPCGPAAKLHTDQSTIDLLVDEVGEEDFLEFCRSNKFVKEVIVDRRFKRKKVSVKMLDGSEVRLKLIRDMVLKTLSTLPVDDVFESSNENQYGIMVPSVEHQFEYILMKSQFSKTAFPDKYQKYFSAMDPAIRSSIFRYMQLKYNFVFNIIEDLYKPKNSLLFKITIGLRALPCNSLSQMIWRGCQLFLWNIFFLFYKKSKRLGPLVEKASTEKNNRASANFI